MPKPNPLTQGLKQARRPEPAPVARATETKSQPAEGAATPTKRVAPSREGRVLVGGHFAPEVQTALKIIAAQERSSVQALLAEGINAVLARRHQPQIASLTAANGEG